jgi:hypothetical protein
MTSEPPVRAGARATNNASRYAALLALASAVYLVFTAFPLDAQQGPTARVMKVVLALAFVAAVFFHRHILGINPTGLPTLKELSDLDCSRMSGTQCQERCARLKKTLMDLLHSGRLKSLGRGIWKSIGLAAGAVGIALALLTSTGGLALVGVAVALPGVLGIAVESPKEWEYWEDRVDELREDWAAFQLACLG